MQGYNKDNARKYGIKAAVILEKLIYFAASNIITGQYQYEGRTYINTQGIKGLAKTLDELTPSQIRYNLDKLEKAAAIEKTNAYNRNKYDRSQLICLSDEFKEQIYNKIQQIQQAKNGGKIKTEPKTRANQKETPAAPMENTTPEAPPEASQNEKAVYHIFAEHYKRIYKTQPPPINHYTAKAAAEIYGYIIKDIETKTGSTQHAREDILKQIDWYFYAAAYQYKDQPLKFNLMYFTKAGEKITATLETLARQHFNKHHKFKRGKQTYINTKGL